MRSPSKYNVSIGAPDVSGSGWYRWAAIGLTAAFVAFYALHVLRHSDFTNDDLDNFLLMRRMDFWSFVLTPTDVHFVPLHRLETWLVYHVAPMNFAVAVLVATAFHIGAIVYLFRILRLLGTDGIGYLIVTCYAVSITGLMGMLWWAHAEHRFPYVFFAVVAIYHYLAWLRFGGRWRVAVCLLAYLAGFGVYEMTVMVPAQMLVIGVLADPRGFRADWRRAAGLPIFLGLLSVAYVATYLTFAPPGVHAGIRAAVGADLEFIKVLGIGISSILVYHRVPDAPIGWSVKTMVVAALWLALFIVTVWRNRRCLWLWAGLCGVVFLNFLPVAVSNRIYYFQLLLPHFYRFTFEELYLVAIFLGLILRESLAAGVAMDAAQRHVSSMPKYAALFVASYAVANLVSLHAGRHRLGAMLMQQQAHSYMGHLRHDLAQLPDARPSFERSRLPGYMSVFHLVHDAGAVVQLFVPQASIRQPAATADYRVTGNGRVVPVS